LIAGRTAQLLHLSDFFLGGVEKAPLAHTRAYMRPPPPRPGIRGRPGQALGWLVCRSIAIRPTIPMG
jgi:hypothetical protein